MAPIKPLGVPKKESVMNIVVAGASGALSASTSVAGAMNHAPTVNCPGGRGLIHHARNWRALEDWQHARPPEAVGREYGAMISVSAPVEQPAL
jgi:hypothetical protein